MSIDNNNRQGSNNMNSEDLLSAEETKRHLWSRISNQNKIDVDMFCLHKLATFVEKPTFRFSTNDHFSSITFPQRELTNITTASSSSFLPKLSVGLTYRKVDDDFLKTNLTREKEIAARILEKALSLLPPGGEPLSSEIACELRCLVNDGVYSLWSRDWRNACFLFSDINGIAPYGLMSTRSGTRTLTLCVQAFLIKHLFFGPTVSDTNRASYLHPSDWLRRDCLVHAMVEILWQAKGVDDPAIICLPCSEPVIKDPLPPAYRLDGITEKVLIYKFHSLKDCFNFMRKNINNFQSPSQPGCILFLYSLILTRTFNKLKQDMINLKKKNFINEQDQMSQCCVNLLLTGAAVPFLHNGTHIYDDDGEILSEPLKGIQHRSEVGFLHWDKRLLDPQEMHENWHYEIVGSMLKTPKHPIWLTNINNNQPGLLFCINPDLVNHWRAENKFTLIYYNALNTQTATGLCRLLVDTRRGNTATRFRSKLQREEEKRKIPPLIHCLHTKWYGVFVEWTGGSPYP